MVEFLKDEFLEIDNSWNYGKFINSCWGNDIDDERMIRDFVYISVLVDLKEINFYDRFFS